MSKKYWLEAAIVHHEPVSDDTYFLSLEAPAIAAAARPGQFVMVKVSATHDPLLNRPLGIAGVRAADGGVQLFYRTVGRGTALLAGRRKGETLHLAGPLGNGFEIKAARPLLVGGGIGLAPLLFAAQSFGKAAVEVLAAGRTEEDLFWVDLFASACGQVHITTDDGSLGAKGTCMALLPRLLKERPYDELLVCGPTPMMRAAAACAAEHGVACQVSLEKHMGCGFGGCLTCNCDAKDGGQLQVCKHGPVFRAEEVDLG